MSNNMSSYRDMRAPNLQIYYSAPPGPPFHEMIELILGIAELSLKLRFELCVDDCTVLQ